MIKKIPGWIKARTLEITNSIAYYPALISVLMGVLSLGLLLYRQQQPDLWLHENLPLLLQFDTDAARNLLSVITAGSISIAVFSFSMVMVVLSQASNNYSPKILDDLVSDKRPQRAMGVYIGTVVFCLPHLLFSQDEQSPPVAVVLVATALGIANMFIFIAFIHYVSKSLKPSEVCRRIYEMARQPWPDDSRLPENAQPGYRETGLPDQHRYIISSPRSGYFQELTLAQLYSLSCENDICVEVLPRKGDYVMKGAHLLTVYGAQAPEDELADELAGCFMYYSFENVEKNPTYAYRQLSEVAVKALSPGINDGATARVALDFLGDLLSNFNSQKVLHTLRDEQGALRIVLHPVDLSYLFEMCLDPIRLYGRGDKGVMYSCLQVCRQLLQSAGPKAGLQHEVKRFSDKLVEDLQRKDGLTDRDYLLRFYENDVKPLLGSYSSQN